MNTKKIEELLATIVEKNCDSDKDEMLNALKELDSIVQQNEGLDPRLQHFLQRRSYQKALDWINSEENN